MWVRLDVGWEYKQVVGWDEAKPNSSIAGKIIETSQCEPTNAYASKAAVISSR